MTYAFDSEFELQIINLQKSTIPSAYLPARTWCDSAKEGKFVQYF
jgi:hypothetical protein